MLLSVGLAGALGSIVSIMVRIQQFANTKLKDPSLLFWTGLFKPVIGSSFALFVFCAVNSGLIPLTTRFDPGKPETTYVFLAFSFVAGFSERFAKDVAAKTEGFLQNTGGQTTE